ncbi:MAG: prepilin-type N-terminal cleavage/methylation domain-containing protein [Betaproteobacteria bacterium]|nr:prepilin-type N-terminal cleavage/methylation domain-containing protein [Betaproteobacteria bacterium]
MKSVAGFTLIELLITMVVLAIVAAIAIPIYTNYVRRGEITDATDTLSSLYVQMEQDYQDNNNYEAPNNTSNCAVGATPTSTNSSTTQYFTYACALSNSGQNYTITATGATGTLMSGFTYQITDANLRSSTVSGVSGWTGNSNCWVTNEGGQC